MAGRRRCKELYCDNATNCVGSGYDHLFKWDTGDDIITGSSRGVNFNFIPPWAPIPITTISANPYDLTTLISGHFLIGELLRASVDPDPGERKPSLINRWKLASHLKHEFGEDGLANIKRAGVPTKMKNTISKCATQGNGYCLRWKPTSSEMAVREICRNSHWKRWLRKVDRC